MKNKWQTFVNEIPTNCVIKARVSDNQLDEEDWGECMLLIKDAVVDMQINISEGVYKLPDFCKWSVFDLIQWSNFDGTGDVVENYHELMVVFRKVSKPAKDWIKEITNGHS